MSFARKVRLAGFLALITAAVMLAAPSAWAASAVATDVSAGTIGVDIPKAIFGVSLTGGGSLTLVRASFAQVGDDSDFDVAGDLQASPNGVALYRDSSREGDKEDRLDLPGDTRVSSGYTSTGLDVEVDIQPALAPPPPEGDYNLFVVVQASGSIAESVDFTMSLPSGVNQAFSTGLLSPTLFNGVTSAPIVVDNEVPTAHLSSAPTTVDGNVVWEFSEDVVGVSEENVVLREDGDPNTDIPTEVTYDSVSLTATIDPVDPLTPGKTYDTIVNPDGAPELVSDQAGNPVAADTADFFSLAGVGFTPGIVRGNTWMLSNGPHRIVDTVFQFGKATDFPIVGDWDGDGEWNVGVVRGNVWYLANEMPPATVTSFAFGRATDFPVVGDWDGNGTYTPGLVRGNQWFLTNSIPPVAPLTTFAFAKATDFPVVGDWNGNGSTTPGVVRGNVWYLTNQIAPQTVTSYPFGQATDFPITGDWDDNGRWTVGVVRGNVWYQTNQSPPQTANSFAFGLATDFPIVGDWDGPSEASSAGLLPKLVPGS